MVAGHTNIDPEEQAKAILAERMVDHANRRTEAIQPLVSSEASTVPALELASVSRCPYHDDVICHLCLARGLSW